MYNNKEQKNKQETEAIKSLDLFLGSTKLMEPLPWQQEVGIFSTK